MKLGEVIDLMQNHDMLYVWMGMHKFYSGLVRQGKEELQEYMNREVAGLSPSMLKGLMVELKEGGISHGRGHGNFTENRK